MKQTTTLTAGCLSAALLCAPVYGGDFQGRWYLGLGGGVSQLEPETENSQYELDETEGTSVGIVLGRDITSHLSLEMYFADLGEVTLKPRVNAVNPTADPFVGYRVGGVHLLAYLFNSDGDEGRFYRDRFSVFAKIGAGTMDNESNVEYERLEDLHLTLGLGMEGLIGGGVSWRAEVNSYDIDAMQGSLGLVKRFGIVRSPVAAVAAEPAGDDILETRLEAETMTMAETPSPVLVAEPVMTPEPVVVPEPAIETVAVVERTSTAISRADSDGDGVLDASDRCAGTEDGVAVDVRGCAFSGIIEGLYFDRGSAKLSSSARSILDNIVLELRRFPNIVLEVQAHTDNRGTATDNLALSQLRAETVASYMINRGISANRIRARGFGESRPAFRNATEEGRRRNRRVVFQTVEKMN